MSHTPIHQHAYTRMHTYTPTHLHVYTATHIHTYTRTNTHLHTCMHTYIHIHVYTCTHTARTRIILDVDEVDKSRTIWHLEPRVLTVLSCYLGDKPPSWMSVFLVSKIGGLDMIDWWSVLCSFSEAESSHRVIWGGQYTHRYTRTYM